MVRVCVPNREQGLNSTPRRGRVVNDDDAALYSNMSGNVLLSTVLLRQQAR